MTEEQQAAYVNSQVACAMIEMQSMAAANNLREREGVSPDYGEAEFLGLIEKYGIHPNAVLGLFGR